VRRDMGRTNARCSPAHIQKKVHQQVVDARRRLTFYDLERQIALLEDCPRSLVRSAIRSLIEQGILEYTYTFGQSYLVMSFRNPVDVSPLFTIIPPGYAGDIASHRHRITIAPGVSFGSGRHPTTRLALRALEEGLLYLRLRGLSSIQTAIDIGTGSGILAIAASCLGAETVMALDVDACARSEARMNIDLNPRAGAVVSVSDTSLAAIQQRFDLVMANLRLPTLIHLSAWIQSHLRSVSCVVVSGFREEERDRLHACYARQGFHSLWQGDMTGWSAGLFYPVDTPLPKV